VRRAAIYTRYSSDNQNDRSIEDQVALCREVAAREGLAVILLFEDRAISGTATVNRPGFQSMLQAASNRLFDVLLVEDLDRFSRDQGDYHAARKQLEFFGVQILTPGGKVTHIDGSLRALMGELYVENLRGHVKRGMMGVIRDGRHAGGRAYGYRTVSGQPGQLQINEEEANVVREIFSRFIHGETPRAIASLLNARRVPAPRGTRWNASTINGHRARGSGILFNALYSGKLVWNRTRMVKAPSNGKRVSRINSPDEYRLADVPHLCIIDDQTWQAAQVLKQKRQLAHADCQDRGPRRFLSGLLRCGSCGGAMISVGRDKGGFRLQCSSFRESGTCQNGRRVKRDAIESAVLGALESELGNPLYLAEFVEAYNKERKRLAKQVHRQRDDLERRVEQLGRELNRAIDLVLKNGADPAAMAQRINELELQRSEAVAKLAEVSNKEPVALHPTAIDRYRQSVGRLTALLTSQPVQHVAELVETVRALILAVVVHAKPNSTGFEIEIKGRLAELTDAPIYPSNARGEYGGSGRGTRTPDPRIMIPVL
jgi:site-specific DNA recombinase